MGKLTPYAPCSSRLFATSGYVFHIFLLRSFARKCAVAGNLHITKAQYFLALAQFEKALEASPNIPEILLGYCQAIFCRSASASEHCETFGTHALQVLLFLNRHEDAIRQSEFFLPLAPSASQPYLLRGCALHFLERNLEAITCFVIGLHLMTLSKDSEKCREQFELYLAKAKAALLASGDALTGEIPLPAPPVVEGKGETAVRKEVTLSPSPSAAIAGSFDEDADARGFMRPVETATLQTTSELQISLHGVDPADLELKNFLQQSLTLAASASATKKFNLAMSIYRQVLDAVPKQQDALRGIAKVHEYHQRWQECLNTYDALLSHNEYTAAPSDYVALARVCLKLKKTVEAGKTIEKARQSLSILGVLGRPSDAGTIAEMHVLEIKILLAKGEYEEALRMVISSLQRDDNNIALLMIYAEMCTMREQLGEAVKVYLRCLVIDSTNVSVRRALSQAIQRPNGVAVAMQELSDAASSGPALAFMATLVKDYSAIDQSLGLYKRAVDVCPNNPSYSLNLIHTHELCYRYAPSNA
jgi:tetratricopeptide (TPR) repeat protein